MQITFDLIAGSVKWIYKRIVLGNRLYTASVIRMSRTASIKARHGAKISIGKCSSLSSHSVVSATENARIYIGDYTGINYNTVIVAREKIDIGNNVMIGPDVAIYDHDHVFCSDEVIRKQGYVTKPIVIEDNVWLGAGVIVLKGVKIGKGSIVGAGTIVTKDIPEYSLVYDRKELVVKSRK